MEKTSPYQGLEARAFWRTFAEGAYPGADLYRPKWALSKSDRIVTAGSCFAQHVGRALRANGFNVQDAEPAPPSLAPERHGENGYGMYSARYGNIYTTRQLRQLMEEAWDGPRDFDAIWTKGDRFHDALRPNVDPQGLASAQAVRDARALHLSAVKRVFAEADVFIFTLGLTEAWVHKASGQVYPTAPGTVAGVFDPASHGFVNFRAAEVRADLVAALARLKAINPNLRVLLTVSPVPLTATASGQHILSASTWSKSVLRAVAGELYEDFPEVDYFPSYEIVTSTRAGASFFEPNIRQVTEAGVARVMEVFTAAHLGEAPDDKPRKRSEEERRARKEDRKAKKG
ncbi:GSCFA domain-containing protein [Rhodobacter sp. KR11]|uniref:GSCFA domain-containing protein n=1 Tax=Rhodobacter sp. KR11 TaxID=2974588 RepID=UPI002223DDE4|nr:GSCFA domain-containing protein [Rhodobacter sp. KR11]MCW1919485.1 GSCFA domain-containing protein [Rhodobacter sp. KR11]